MSYSNIAEKNLWIKIQRAFLSLWINLGITVVIITCDFLLFCSFGIAK